MNKGIREVRYLQLRVIRLSRLFSLSLKFDLSTTQTIFPHLQTSELHLLNHPGGFLVYLTTLEISHIRVSRSMHGYLIRGEINVW